MDFTAVRPPPISSLESPAYRPPLPPPPPPGWKSDFIPLVLEKGLDLKLDEDMLEIPDGAAVAMSKSLAMNEGILTGISGGMGCAGGMGPGGDAGGHRRKVPEHTTLR